MQIIYTDYFLESNSVDYPNNRFSPSLNNNYRKEFKLELYHDDKYSGDAVLAE